MIALDYSNRLGVEKRQNQFRTCPKAHGMRDRTWKDVWNSII